VKRRACGEGYVSNRHNIILAADEATGSGPASRKATAGGLREIGIKVKIRIKIKMET
jgi:hypothetical protein